MQVELIIDETLDKNNIVIQCQDIDKRIKKIKCFAEKLNTRIIGKSDNEKIFISPEDIYYIESVDKKTFIYLVNEVWECNLRLYEIEEVLNGLTFFS